MRRSTVTVTLCTALLSSGCTAVLSTVRVMDARRAVNAAEAKDASALAPYEYRLAVEHLAKASEESGDAQHKRAVELAKAAKQWAEAAVIRIDGGGEGRTVESAGEDLLDAAAPKPAATPDPGPQDPRPPARPEEPEEKEKDPFEDLEEEEEEILEGKP